MEEEEHLMDVVLNGEEVEIPSELIEDVRFGKKYTATKYQCTLVGFV